MANVIANLAPIGQSNVILYKNQNLVIVEKEECSNDFLMVSNEYWMKASRLLKDSAFRIYMYFASNKDGYQFALSPVAISNAIGVSKRSYTDAIKELIEKEYLLKCDTKKNLGYETYRFRTTPFNEANNAEV